MTAPARARGRTPHAGVEAVAADRTVLGALATALADAARYDHNEQARSAVVLWPDKERQWERLLPLLRAAHAHLLTLGPLDPAARSGPAVWCKCMLARTLPEADWAADAVPVLYLPGVARAELRGVEDCPPALQPLAELQYRGTWFSQQSHKDWTVLAFLAGRTGAGLGLDVARDAATAELLQAALAPVGRLTVSVLAEQPVTAKRLRELLGHSERAVLDWLDEPGTAVRERDPGAWAAFASGCRTDYGFDPDEPGARVAAAERLGRRQGAWGKAWARWAEAPGNYPRIPELLRAARPAHAATLFDARDPWPQENEAAEAALRTALAGMRTLAHADALGALRRLEQEHGERRGWVWAALGRAPLAEAIEPLSVLAEAAASPVTGATRDAFAAVWRSGGWRADAAALEALAVCSHPADAEAVEAAVRALYLPWLEKTAARFQTLLAAEPLPRAGAGVATGAVPVAAEAGTCLLFADGLRWDVGQRVADLAHGRGWAVEEGWRWAALPSVTATAKPAASPVADLVAGLAGETEFAPVVKASGQPLTADRFRRLLADRGVTYLARGETGDPRGAAWTEIGDLDRQGHAEQARLARRVDECVAELVARVQALFDAGWARVRVVTDHGWLLVPGGLPKVTLHKSLAASRWGRCAALTDAAAVDVPTVVWHWNVAVRVALAPAAGAFYEGVAYAHGGATVQECVVPELVIVRPGGALRDVRIAEARWVGLTCKATVAGDFAGCRVELRARAQDAASALAAGKAVKADGQASLLVDDEHEGAPALLVLLGPDGAVLDKRATAVGG